MMKINLFWYYEICPFRAYQRSFRLFHGNFSKGIHLRSRLLCFTQHDHTGHAGFKICPLFKVGSVLNTRTILTLLLKQGIQRRVLQHSPPSVSMGGHGSIQHYAHQGCWSFLPLCNPSFRAVRHISQNHFHP